MFRVSLQYFCVFQLHLAALASLRGEILDLSSRLQAVTEERDILEKSLSQSLNSMKQQYEERLTELHSVIAELTRKLERQRSLVIAEEEDAPSGMCRSFIKHSYLTLLFLLSLSYQLIVSLFPWRIS